MVSFPINSDNYLLCKMKNLFATTSSKSCNYSQIALNRPLGLLPPLKTCSKKILVYPTYVKSHSLFNDSHLLILT